MGQDERLLVAGRVVLAVRGERLVLVAQVTRPAGDAGRAALHLGRPAQQRLEPRPCSRSTPTARDRAGFVAGGHVRGAIVRDHGDLNNSSPEPTTRCCGDRGIVRPTFSACARAIKARRCAAPSASRGYRPCRRIADVSGRRRPRCPRRAAALLGGSWEEGHDLDVPAPQASGVVATASGRCSVRRAPSCGTRAGAPHQEVTATVETVQSAGSAARQPSGSRSSSWF